MKQAVNGLISYDCCALSYRIGTTVMTVADILEYLQAMQPYPANCGAFRVYLSGGFAGLSVYRYDIQKMRNEAFLNDHQVFFSPPLFSHQSVHLPIAAGEPRHVPFLNDTPDFRNLYP